MIDADPASGLVKVGGGHRARRPQRGAAPARPGDGEPRRHRPPDDRRRDLDRHPRHRREAAQHLLPGRGDRAGPRRRQRARAERRRRPRPAARGAGRGRRARRDLRGDPALRPRLHPATGSTRPRPREEVLDTFQERADANDHFELFTFPYADSRPGPRAQPHRGAAAPARPGRRLPQRHRARELGAGGALGDRQGASRGRSRALSRLAARARLGQPGDRPQRPDLRQRAPRPLHRDGVRGAARARARGGAAGDRVGARATATRSSSRSRCGSTAADDALLSPSHERDTAYIAVHQYRGMEWRPYFEAVEEIMNAYGGRPHWGKRHFQTADDPGAALPALGRVPGRPRRARPRPRLHQRVRRPRVLGP